MSFVPPTRFVSPDVVASHFHIKEGDLVVDFGAGSGFFLKVLSEKAGSEGGVYACEVQKQLVEKLAEVARLNNLGNVHVIWCDIEEENGIKLRDGQLDVGILVNTLFQFENKEDAITEMRRVLRSGATLHVIDWTESFAGLGPQPNDILIKEDAIALFESAGFVLETEFPAGDHHYGFTVRKI